MRINPVATWNFDAEKAEVLAKINVLRTAAFAAEEQGELGQQIIRDLIVPNMLLLGHFCANVKQESGPPLLDRSREIKPLWIARLSAKSKADVFAAISETSNRALAERWWERAREEMREVRLDPEDSEGAWWECTLDVRGIVDLDVLLSATRDRTIGVELWCYTPTGTAKLGDCESRFWPRHPE